MGVALPLLLGGMPFDFEGVFLHAGEQWVEPVKKLLCENEGVARPTETLPGTASQARRNDATSGRVARPSASPAGPPRASASVACSVSTPARSRQRPPRLRPPARSG